MNTNSEFVGRHPIIRNSERRQLKASQLFDRGVRLIVDKLREPSTDLFEELRHTSGRLVTALSLEAPRPIQQPIPDTPRRFMAGGIAAHETYQTVAVLDHNDNSTIELSDVDVDRMFETILVKCL